MRILNIEAFVKLAIVNWQPAYVTFAIYVLSVSTDRHFGIGIEAVDKLAGQRRIAQPIIYIKEKISFRNTKT